MSAGARIRDLAGRVARRWRDVASTLVLEVASLVSLFVTFPITIRALGPELYGKYTVLYLVFGLAGLWVYSGLSAAVVQLILQLEYGSEEVLRLGRRQIMITGLPAVVIGTVVVMLLVGWELFVPAVLVLGVDFFLASLASLYMSEVLAIDGVVRAAHLRLWQPVVRVIGVVALAVVGQVTIITLVCVNIAMSAILLARSHHAIKHRVMAARADHHPGAREVAHYSVLYAVSMSTNAAQDEGEKFVMASTRTKLEVGEYAAAYRIVSPAMIPLNALIAAAGRWFLVRDHTTGAQVARTARLSLVTAAYGIVAAMALLLSTGIVGWVVGSEFEQAPLIVSWLCLLPLFQGLAELPTMGLLGLNRNRARMNMGIGTCVAALVAYVALVPTFGWRGAVIGTYVSELVCIVAGWILLIRYQRLADAEVPAMREVHAQ
jgi:O-antigen/teichoic acid export membrane protein